MDRVYVIPVFKRWMKKAGLVDRALIKAMKEMKNGLIDADLGAGLFKKRVPLPGRGKRGAARTLLATNRKERWIFLFEFQKNERENVTAHELEALQELASDLLGFSDNDMTIAVEKKELLEVHDETEE